MDTSNRLNLTARPSVSKSTKLPVVILISGRGSNLQSLIDGMRSKALPIDIKAVISNRPDVQGLKRARDAGIPALALDHKQFESREAFDSALQDLIDEYNPGLVILAGFMRILTPKFVNHYLGRMLNIHPSLLPKYSGLNTHQRALENNDSKHGASIHFVTTELDGGPVVIQVEVPVQENDTADSLALRVLEQEHPLYQQAVKWFAEGRLKFENNQVLLDGTILKQPVSLK